MPEQFTKPTTGHSYPSFYCVSNTPVVRRSR